MEELLSIKGLTKHFGKNKALDNVDFSLSKGEIVGLVGPNGAGKTTIMKAALGLIQYDEGLISVEGNPVSPTSHQALGNVGALIEYPGIYPFLSGYDHLKLFAVGENVDKIGEIVSMLKMEGYIHKKAKSYSMGMKQKLGIALAIINAPHLVILDEPVNGLDPQATRDVREIILDLVQKGTAFLISSHILGELEKIVDRLVIIDDGKIIKQVTMDEINAETEQMIVLRTTDDAKAKELLKEKGYSLADSEQLQIHKDSDEQLAEIIKELSADSISILDVTHQKNDLEETLLQLLDTKESGIDK